MTTEPEVTVVTPSTPQSPTPNTLAGVTALARFEFEPGRGNEGTKIMMVEWQDDVQSRDKAGSWHISWQDKNTIFPADDEPTDNIRRLYFLLPPGATVPPHITIAYQSPKVDQSTNSATLRMRVNPLPAIFTPELGATVKASGKKGVLHTIWAKKRLQVLENEIRKEQEFNLEGIALEMAVAEKEWIENNFGISTKPLTLDTASLPKFNSQSLNLGIQSPRSPGGGRLSEKLKGLSIGTSERDLAGRGVNTPTREAHPLSPEMGDVAYSSFSAFRERPISSQPQQGTQQQPQQPTPSMSRPTVKRAISQAPPDYIRQQQQAQNGLGFLSQSTPKPVVEPKADDNVREDNDDSDDLFAKALSPRSPDDPKSPFSIPSSEVGAFARIKGSQRV